MRHVLDHLTRCQWCGALGLDFDESPRPADYCGHDPDLPSPRPERQTGAPRSATSAAPQGCEGSGYGVTNPMSHVVRHVPLENANAPRAAAQGIVTRMGQDPQGLGGAAIEPGSVGMRPAACVPCSGFHADCDGGAATCARARTRSAGAGAGAGRAPAIPDGNHGDNQKEVTE